MTLHVFNPEHDIALAYHRRHLTMPHAAQELRMNLGWIPAIWAADGDAVLVDDVDFAKKCYARYRGEKKHILFLSHNQLHHFTFSAVSPWGWDLTLVTELAEAGIDSQLLPSAETLDALRNLSHRRHTSGALLSLRDGLEADTCGCSYHVASFDELQDALLRHPHAVVKAPWSSSGRGVRYVGADGLNASAEGFVRRVIQRQGGIMVEPYYNKVKDFGMEFLADSSGQVSYLGLSLFQTSGGAYVGNILASEEQKLRMLSHYVSPSLLGEVRERACAYFSRLFGGIYQGPFGVDMMVVARNDRHGFLLHPCVEINLRRTMGHVALTLQTEMPSVMTITYNVNYGLRVRSLQLKDGEED